MATTQVSSKTNKPKRGKSTVLFWSPECKYEVILNNVKALHRDERLSSILPLQTAADSQTDEQNNDGRIIINNPKWELLDDEKYETKANIYWIDVSSIHERFRSIQPWQIINHFPGMPNIARKNRMGQNLNKMLKLFPKEYAFYPKTWVLPGELSDFRQQFDNQGYSLNNKIFIIKPDTGCQGRGIFLTRSFDNVPQSENVVAQVYIKKPLLLDGFKFDLRIYCFVTSVKPLRIYLFQDGLVRMCTEEYEKPNKQNIAMACMHLTNYAVNKHNSNFQQPSAQTTEGNQDDASKRSLKWFMNYITEQHGDQKASWLWRRIGTLCVRSIMSIMPTLSREYDQHFKSFTGVPTVVPEYSFASGAPTSDTSSKSGSRRSSTAVGSAEDVNGAESSPENTENSQTNSRGESTKPSVPENYPGMRGSRCFEVLGFDIMIDANLKPWIIEVNHLPSFGTDSPLDLDIKDRLMKQVLQCVAALPDDEQAYTNYHKSEASKRLVETKPPKPKETPPPVPPKKKPLVRPKPQPKPAEVKPVSSRLVAEPFDTGFCLPERLAEIKAILADIYQLHSPDKVSKIDRLLAKYEFREEEFLKYVYAKYNITPPWVIAQQLVAEAEAAAMMNAQKNLSQTQPEDKTSSGSSSDNEAADETNDSIASKDVNQSKSAQPNDSLLSTQSTVSSTTSRRPREASRSVSPPAARSRSVGPSWKMAADEEAQYRQEVLASYFPKNDDEWMLREMSFLTQFTRIFPPEGSYSNKSNTALTSRVVDTNQPSLVMSGENDEPLEGRDEDNDQDDEEDQPTADTNNAQVATYKPASYEDILYQVFLQDKRQTMRLRCPLPNRAKVVDATDTQSLPPVERSKGYLYNSMGNSTGKGAVGWKLPAMSGTEKKDIVVKSPTESQVAAAARLSQGLSVAEQQHKYLRNRNKTNTAVRTVHPSIVMDQRTYAPIINITNMTFIPNASPITNLLIPPSANDSTDHQPVSSTKSSNAITQKKNMLRSDSKKEYQAEDRPKGQISGRASKDALQYESQMSTLLSTSPKGQIDPQTKEAVLKHLFPGWF